jgi:hypothetical protein
MITLLSPEQLLEATRIAGDWKRAKFKQGLPFTFPEGFYYKRDAQEIQTLLARSGILTSVARGK